MPDPGDNHVMCGRPPPPSGRLVALLILGGAGLGLIAVGVTTQWGWTLFVPGFVALLIALPGLWAVLKSRNETFR
jgi:hypothetical protein